MGRGFATAGAAVILLILTVCNPLTVTAETGSEETIEVESNGDIGWVRLSCDTPNSGACNTASIRVIDSDGEVHELDADASNSAETWLDGGEGTVSIHLPPQHNSSYWNVHYVIPTSEGHEVGDHPESMSDPDVQDANEGQNTGLLVENDVDAIHIPSGKGDIITLNLEASRTNLSIDVYDKSTQPPSLIGNTDGGNLVVESPSDEGLDLKVRASGGSEDNPYRFEMQIHTDVEEISDPIPPLAEWQGSIGPSDTSGDLISLQVGASNEVRIAIHSSDLSAMDIERINGDSNENLTESNEQNPNLFVIEDVGATTVVVILRVTSEDAVTYSVSHTVVGPRDGETLGDAPNRMFEEGDNSAAWPTIVHDGVQRQGHLSSPEDIDIWLLEIETENGSNVKINPSVESTNCCLIQILNVGDNGTLGGFTTEQNLSKGTHAIRVSKNPNWTGVWNPYYSFTVTETPLDGPAVYVDRSDEFMTFYLLAGFLFLSPLLPIAYWQWKERGTIRVERHERRRLSRLRERLSGIGLDSQHDEDIDAALNSLGDSEWDAIVDEWGEPLLRYRTEDIEIAAWKPIDMEATLLVGLRPIKEWSHAGLRLSVQSGERIEINDVNPKRIHFEDEIAIDRLPIGELLFLRICHEVGPKKMDIILNGTINGEQVTAMPPRAVDTEEE
ncbi:MAG: Uncharacterised protein [Methanobacteriota archaeon]|nr:MAG: Uncharacterised protein [Euryarchaeota archaeon]